MASTTVDTDADDRAFSTGQAVLYWVSGVVVAFLALANGEIGIATDPYASLGAVSFTFVIWYAFSSNAERRWGKRVDSAEASVGK